MQCMKFVCICFYIVTTKKRLLPLYKPWYHSQVYHYPVFERIQGLRLKRVKVRGFYSAESIKYFTDEI
jgi:hypothetical protein